MIFAVIGIFAALGCVVYLQLYNQLARKWGQQMAFGTIVIIDVVWLLMLLFFICIGKYGAPAVGCDDGEDQEMQDLRGPDDGEGYGDIPKEFANNMEFEGKDEPYSKKILDADEEYERSQRSGSINPKIVKKASKRGSLNEDLMNAQDEDYDYDFDGEHFERGSIYSKRQGQ